MRSIPLSQIFRDAGIIPHDHGDGATPDQRLLAFLIIEIQLARHDMELLRCDVERFRKDVTLEKV